MTGNDKNPYFNAYEGLFAWNLIVEDVPDATECTEVQRRQLIAQGRVLRAMHYFIWLIFMLTSMMRLLRINCQFL